MASYSRSIWDACAIGLSTEKQGKEACEIQSMEKGIIQHDSLQINSSASLCSKSWSNEVLW